MGNVATSHVNFHTPPCLKGVSGNQRRIGFEFEFAGMTVDECAQAIAQHYNGDITRYHSQDSIVHTDIGEFHVELDALLVKNMSHYLENDRQANHTESAGDEATTPSLSQEVSRYIGQAASQIVPVEFSTPPLTLSHCLELVSLCEKLQQKNILRGTSANPVYAFGMHINPEAPSAKTHEIRDMVRAFIVLYPWLKQQLRVNLSRRILSYINPFPRDYGLFILRELYDPSLDEFIADYVRYNPTRNRALDLLPLLAHMQPSMKSMLSAEEQSLLTPRPTYHYRLPNCDIDNPDWSIAEEWNRWVLVERLAADKPLLAELSQRYRQFLNEFLHSLNEESWISQLDEVIAREELYAA